MGCPHFDWGCFDDVGKQARGTATYCHPPICGDDVCSLFSIFLPEFETSNSSNSSNRPGERCSGCVQPPAALTLTDCCEFPCRRQSNAHAAVDMDTPQGSGVVFRLCTYIRGRRMDARGDVQPSPSLIVSVRLAPFITHFFSSSRQQWKGSLARYFHFQERTMCE